MKDKKLNNNENVKTEVSFATPMRPSASRHNRSIAVFTLLKCFLGKIGSEVGEVRLWQNQRSTVHDSVGSHDFAKDHIATALTELLQELKS